MYLNKLYFGLGQVDPIKTCWFVKENYISHQTVTTLKYLTDRVTECVYKHEAYPAVTVWVTRTTFNLQRVCGVSCAVVCVCQKCSNKGKQWTVGGVKGQGSLMLEWVNAGFGWQESDHSESRSPLHPVHKWKSTNWPVSVRSGPWSNGERWHLNASLGTRQAGGGSAMLQSGFFYDVMWVLFWHVSPA